MGGLRLNTTAVAEALRKTHGNYRLAAMRLRCSRMGLYRVVAKNPDLQEIIQQERDGVVDVAESKLGEAVERGEAWAIMFTLKTIGKYRGYSERSERVVKKSVLPYTKEEMAEKIRLFIHRYPPE
jgi:hypothetical protein